MAPKRKLLHSIAEEIQPEKKTQTEDENESMVVDPELGDEASTSAAAKAEELKKKKEEKDAKEKEKKEKADENSPKAPRRVGMAIFLHLHEYFILQTGIEHSNINKVGEITSTLLSVHHALRQQYTPANKGKLSEKVTDFVCNGKHISKKKLFEAYEAILEIYDVGFADRNSKEILNVLSTYLTYSACFKNRMREVRFGLEKIPTGIMEPKIKNGERILEEKYLKCTDYGCTRPTAYLLSGTNISPHIQSSMRPSLGPMLQVHLYRHSRDAYLLQWRKHLEKVFGVIPERGVILDGLLTSNYSPFLQTALEVCNLGLVRHAHKMFLPAAFILKVARTDKVYESFFGKTVREEPVQCPHPLWWFDASGHGAIHVYNLSTKIVGMKYTSLTKAEYMNEMFFHAVWGTHVENLELLAWLTGREFVIRDTIGKAWNDPNLTEPISRDVKLIPLTKCSKLVNSTVNKLGTENQRQDIRGAVFAGRCQIEIDEDNSIIKAYRELVAGRNNVYNADPLGNLNACLTRIKESMDKDRFYLWGTTIFYEYDDTSNGKEYGKPIKEIPKFKTSQFYGTK